MRPIDADALMHRMYHDAFETDTDMQKWDSGCWIRYKMFENAIDDAPTIEPKHGEWIAKYEGSYLQRRMYCSVCGKKNGIGGIESNQRKPYCPNCGAKMDGERKEKSDE